MLSPVHFSLALSETVQLPGFCKRFSHQAALCSRKKLTPLLCANSAGTGTIGHLYWINFSLNVTNQKALQQQKKKSPLLAYSAIQTSIWLVQMKTGVVHNPADYQACLWPENNQNVFVTSLQASSSSSSQSAASTRADSDNSDDTKL